MEHHQTELLELYRSRLRRQLILDIINVHPIHGPALADVGAYYGFDFSSGRAAIFVLKLSPHSPAVTPEERRQASQLTEQILRNVLESYLTEFEICSTEDFLVGLFSLTIHTANWKRKLNLCFQTLRQTGALTPFHLILGMGMEATDADTLCQGFRSAMNVLELGIMFGYDRVYDSTLLQEHPPLNNTILSPLHQAVLQDLLSARASKQLETWLDTLFSEFTPIFRLHPAQAFRLPREIMQRADAVARGLPGSEIFHQGNLFDCCVTITQEQEALANMFQRFCNASPSPFSAAVSAVQSHIALHFREHLTLEQLSTHCGLNPQYLSTLYRQETGQTITQHIKFLRILAAQALLRDTPLSIAQIAQQVGYEDPRYFNRVFQKTIGKSPSSFRRDQ